MRTRQLIRVCRKDGTAKCSTIQSCGPCCPVLQSRARADPAVARSLRRRLGAQLTTEVALNDHASRASASPTNKHLPLTHALVCNLCALFLSSDSCVSCVCSPCAGLNCLVAASLLVYCAAPTNTTPLSAKYPRVPCFATRYTTSNVRIFVNRMYEREKITCKTNANTRNVYQPSRM